MPALLLLLLMGNVFVLSESSSSIIFYDAGEKDPLADLVCLKYGTVVNNQSRWYLPLFDFNPLLRTAWIDYASGDEEADVDSYGRVIYTLSTPELNLDDMLDTLAQKEFKWQETSDIYCVSSSNIITALQNTEIAASLSTTTITANLFLILFLLGVNQW